MKHVKTTRQVKVGQGFNDVVVKYNPLSGYLNYYEGEIQHGIWGCESSIKTMTRDKLQEIALKELDAIKKDLIAIGWKKLY